MKSRFCFKIAVSCVLSIALVYLAQSPEYNVDYGHYDNMLLELEVESEEYAMSTTFIKENIAIVEQELLAVQLNTEQAEKEFQTAQEEYKEIEKEITLAEERRKQIEELYLELGGLHLNSYNFTMEVYDYERAKMGVDEAVLKSSIEVYGGFWGEFFLNVANEDKERKLQVVPNYAKKVTPFLVTMHEHLADVNQIVSEVEFFYHMTSSQDNLYFYTNIANEHYGGNISSQHYKENFLELQKEVVVCLDQLELIRCGYEIAMKDYDNSNVKTQIDDLCSYLENLGNVASEITGVVYEMDSVALRNESRYALSKIYIALIDEILASAMGNLDDIGSYEINNEKYYIKTYDEGKTGTVFAKVRSNLHHSLQVDDYKTYVDDKGIIFHNHINAYEMTDDSEDTYFDFSQVQLDVSEPYRLLYDNQ